MLRRAPLLLGLVGAITRPNGESETKMARKNAPPSKRKTRTKKKPDLPLTAKAEAALKKHGPGTTDAIAQRVGAAARAVGKALSALKARGKAYFTKRDGEPVWRRGAPRARAPRKQ